ncbi:MAG: hypothetical protein LCH90_17150 [Proteobacteria bacterium]|nr:hypothetical protein [Pseudomonadota bacterium]
MPVDPNNPHVDVAHELTRVSADFRYPCKDQPRPHISRIRAQDGWHPDGRAKFVEVVSEWQVKPCTHEHSATDIYCGGCMHQKGEKCGPDA